MTSLQKFLASISLILTFLVGAGEAARQILVEISQIQTHLRANDSRLDLSDAPPPNPAAL